MKKNKNIFDVYRKEDKQRVVFIEDLVQMLRLGRITKSFKYLHIPYYEPHYNNFDAFAKPVGIYTKKDINGFLIKMKFEDIDFLKSVSSIAAIKTKTVNDMIGKHITFYLSYKKMEELIIKAQYVDNEHPTRLFLAHTEEISIMSSKKKELAVCDSYGNINKF